MSNHPNVILLLTLTPHGLSRKTMRDILAETGTAEDNEIKLGDAAYHHKVMDGDYDECWQISAKEGDLVIFDLVTYGYGDAIEWEKLTAQKTALEEWAKGICERHKCDYKISVTANYW